MTRLTMTWASLLAAGMVTAAETPRDYSAAVAADLATPVRPGGVDGRPFWNGNSTVFMYPPAFDFRESPTPVDGYTYEIRDAYGQFHSFKAPTPHAALTNVWAELPTGFTTVSCYAWREWSARRMLMGTRMFWKSAPFTGRYPERKYPYAESARMGLEYVLKATSNRYMLEHGTEDPDFLYNAYPAKMHSSVIKAAVEAARFDEKLRDEAIRLAVRSADYLISLSEGADRPLAFFPPTYRGEKVTAAQYAGQVMSIYPATAAEAYAELYELGKDAKYLRAAEGIAATYLKLQGPDGTWALKYTLADGKALGDNRVVPISSIMPMFIRLHRLTGKAEYRAAADRAFAYLERACVANWNWEGQFEDVEPTPPYVNLTKHDACATAIYLVDTCPDDPERIALARELLRFAEDQFVFWERPFQGANYPKGTAALDTENWACPSVTEQYFWYVPIDASAAKLIRTYLALYRAEGKELDLAKARALGDSITLRQWNDGGIPTHWCFREYPNSIWMNCHIYATLALKELAEADAKAEAAGR